MESNARHSLPKRTRRHGRNVVQCLSVVPQQDERADEDQATLVKYGFLASEMLDNHKRYWASSYYWHNKKYDEYEYTTFRKQTEIIVTIFYEGVLRGTQYGNHPRTKYALKIHSIIEDLMNKDWSKVNETLK